LFQFEKLFASDYHLGAAARALRISLLQTLISVLLAFPLAYLMSRVSSGVRTALLIVVILPLMTSVVVRTFGWLVLMGPAGLLGQLPGLEALGSTGQGLLGTEAGVIIAMVQVLLPFAVLTILGVMGSVKPMLEEAARSLGAGFWRTMWHVVLPLTLPGIAAGGTLVFALSVSSFITPRMIGGYQLPVLASTIYTDATSNLDWPFAAAQSVLLFGGVMLVIAAALRGGRARV
jgi:putative spermidine/putrescine transport system permease protein